MTIALRLTRTDAAGAGVVAALTAGLYFAVVAPAQRRQDAVQQQSALLDQIQGDIAAVRRKHEVLLARGSQLDQQLARYRINPEPPSRINARIASINELAAQHGLVLNEVRSDPGSATSTGIAVPIRLGGTGAYAQFASFIAALHRAFPDVAVSSFELAGTPLDAGRNQPIFSADLVWHACAEGAAPAAPADPEAAASNPG